MNRVLILADFGNFGHKINRVWFLYSSLDMAMFLRSHFFFLYRKENQRKTFTNYVYNNLTSGFSLNFGVEGELNGVAGRGISAILHVLEYRVCCLI